MARKILISLYVIVLFMFHVKCYNLKQVFILSRHNVRTPLTDNLQSISTYEFPKWNLQAGHLTDKGRLLEGFMGEYFHEWLVEQNLFSEGCPETKDIHIYANTKQRTRESAKAFAKSAFKGCDIEVFSIDSEEMDPVFNIVPRNTSLKLKEAIVNEMQEKLNGLQLQEPYEELNRILNLNESVACKVDNICDLAEEVNDIVYYIGVEPNINGPLNLGNSIIDNFLMSYYEGMPLEQVAWGQIRSQNQWKLLTLITKENQNVRFNGTVLAKEVAKPLLNYILGVLENHNAPKFTLLMGHDSNLNPVMTSIGFITEDLPGQHERTPVGGKLVIQRIEDDAGKAFMKADFVYQSFEQLRNGTKLSLENPPMWFSMRVEGCSDENGLCSWEYFIDILRRVVQ